MRGNGGLRGLASASLGLGLFAVVAVPFIPPDTCGKNPVRVVLATSAALGVMSGCAGLFGSRRRRAAAGLLVNVSVLPVVLYLPTFWRVRDSFNESGNLQEVRAVISAQALYRDASGGDFDRLECLSYPSRCLPDYPADGPSFLDPSMLAPIRYGYRRSFHPGESASGARSRSALKSFAYVAVPLIRGRTGCRGYCMDSDGILCQTDGRMPRIVGGLCDRSSGSGCLVAK